MKKYFKLISICIGSSAILYLAVWLWFIADGEIPVGRGLYKSDWLQFFGAFLGFLGTTFLGSITLYQARLFHKQTILSEHKAQIYPSVKQTAIMFECTDALDERTEFALDDVLLAKSKSDGHGDIHEAAFFFEIPLSTANEIPEQLRIDEMTIETNVADCEMEIPQPAFRTVKPVKNGLFNYDIIVKIDIGDVANTIRECGKIRFDTYFSAKIGNIITPFYSKYTLIGTGKTNGNDANILIVNDGFIQVGNPHFS